TYSTELTYTLSLFLVRSGFWWFRIFLSPHTTPPPVSTTVVFRSAANNTICCVISLTFDAPRRGGKQRYDYFLSVVHFRKVVIFRKVGSDENGSPVI
ncbi:TPA: hypothetical protein ACUA61_004918, partial [Escherichia coli]